VTAAPGGFSASPSCSNPAAGAWETFAHGADVGVRGFGSSPAEAFANAGMALTSVVTSPGAVRPIRPRVIRCSAPDLGLLLYDWLNALITAMAVDRLLFGRFEVEIDGQVLVARAFGEPLDVARHEPAVEVKGATFTELEVARDPDGRWRAQCVVDV